MLYRMQERARKEIAKGNIDNATRQLQTLAASLLSQGERSLAQTIALKWIICKKRIPSLMREAKKSIMARGLYFLRRQRRSLFHDYLLKLSTLECFGDFVLCGMWRAIGWR